jgi:hypothetical protein
VQWLLVGKHRGGDDAEPDGDGLMAEHDHGAQQEQDGRRDLGGKPFGIGARLGVDEIAGGDEGADGQEGGSQEPGG